MKTVKIDGKEVEMLVNAATSMVHQRIFGEDILIEYNKMFGGKDEIDETDMEINAMALGLIKRIAFTMAMQAKNVGQEQQLLKLTDADFISWLSSFDGPFSFEEASADIMNIYAGNDTPTATAKKEDVPQTES